MWHGVKGIESVFDVPVGAFHGRKGATHDQVGRRRIARARTDRGGLFKFGTCRRAGSSHTIGTSPDGDAGADRRSYPDSRAHRDTNACSHCHPDSGPV